MERDLPHRITFQWHLTDRCNYRCAHCYQHEYQYNGVDFQELVFFLDQMEQFVQAAAMEHKNVKAHINFTGGEPFLRTDFLQLLKNTEDRHLFTFGILTNGLLLPSNQLSELKKLKPRFIQISLDGNQKVNDGIRGDGAYKQAVKAIKTYTKLDIPVMISFTANALNYKNFPDVVRIARRCHAFKVWTDRYLPCSFDDPLVLTTEQTKEYFELIVKEQEKERFHFLSNTKISSNRALQFLIAGGSPYKCAAGNNLLAILPNGDLLPCRRLPIKIGNLRVDNLVDLYRGNIVLRKLKDSNCLDVQCTGCYYKLACNGGLKCLSFSQTGDMFKKDPNCWI